MKINLKSSVFSLFIALIGFSSTAAAQELFSDLYIRESDLRSLKTQTNIIQQGAVARVYLQTDNTGSTDFNGWVTFRDIPTSTVLKKDIPIYVAGAKTDLLWTDITFVDPDEYQIEALITANGWDESDFWLERSTIRVVNDVDSDGDNIFDSEDADDDNDGANDTQDAFPLDSSEQLDTDSDGQGNNADGDDDNDGLYDTEEIALGTDPQKADTDGDGFWDKVDVFPLDPTEAIDTDNDGIGNNRDPDAVMTKTMTTTACVTLMRFRLGLTPRSLIVMVMVFRIL